MLIVKVQRLKHEYQNSEYPIEKVLPAMAREQYYSASLQ